MNKITLFSVLFLISSTSHAAQPERWVGKRNSNGNPCRLEFRQQEYSYPQVFVSFTLGDQEEYGDPMAGLDELSGISQDQFQALFFGTAPLQLKAVKGVIPYDVSASQEGANRVIHAIGRTEAHQHEVEVRYDGKTMSVVHSVSKPSRWTGKWTEIFTDTCSGMKP